MTELTIGPLLRELREATGRSQSDQAAYLSTLADRFITRNEVSRWERETRLLTPFWQERCAKSFGVPVPALNDAVRRARINRRLDGRDDDWSSKVEDKHGGSLGNNVSIVTPPAIVKYIPALRGILDLYDIPEDGPISPLVKLRKRTAILVQRRLNSDYCQLANDLKLVLPELTRALFSFSLPDRVEVAELLAQAYRAADAIADKFGLYDLSARTINVINWAAQQADSPMVTAMAAYVRGETFFASHQFKSGRRFLERAAAEITPGDSLGNTAAYGALHMRAAVLAARAILPDDAHDHLREAREAARRVTEGVYGGTAFGPSSVRIHEVSLSVDLGDPNGALAAAAGWEPATSLPAERRSHFYVDIARAQLLAGRTDHVLDALHTARSIAPQHIQSHPEVRKILPSLVSTGGAVEARAREFCRNARIDLAAT